MLSIMWTPVIFLSIGNLFVLIASLQRAQGEKIRGNVKNWMLQNCTSIWNSACFSFRQILVRKLCMTDQILQLFIFDIAPQFIHTTHSSAKQS